MANYQELVMRAKSFLYRNRGEPYAFHGSNYYFVPGTRPVRTKYKNSPNDNTRYDALQVELVDSVLQEGDHAIDVGAHAGQYGILMSAKCGATGSVVCFEPDPGALDRLRQNVALNPQIKEPEIVTIACSDQRGKVSFFTQDGNSQSSLAKSALPKDKECSEIEVETVRLDDWWETNRPDGVSPALVKIDTEGAEVHVLRGMPKLLQSSAVIVCELHPFAWEEFGVTLDDLKGAIAESGRQLVWLDGSGPVEDPVRYGTVLLAK